MTLKNKFLAAYKHASHISYFNLIANLVLALMWSGTWHSAIIVSGLMLTLKLLLPSNIETSPQKKFFYQYLLSQIAVFGCVGILSVFLANLCFNIIVTPITIHVALFSLGVIQSHCLHRSRCGHFWGIALGTFIFVGAASALGGLSALGSSVTVVSAIIIASTALKPEWSYFSFAMRGLLFFSVCTIEFGLLPCAIAMAGCWLVRGLLYTPQLTQLDRKQYLSVYDISDYISELLNADNRWHLPFGYVVPSDQQMSTEQSLSILHQHSRFGSRLVPLLPRAIQYFEWQVYALFHALETAKNLNMRTQGKQLGSSSPRDSQPLLQNDQSYMQLTKSLIEKNVQIYEAYFGAVLSTYMPQKRYQDIPTHPKLEQALEPNQTNNHQEQPVVNRQDIIIASEIIRQICFEAKPGPGVAGASTFHNHCVAMMSLHGQKTEASSRWGQFIKMGKVVPARLYGYTDEIPQLMNHRWGQERYSIWSVVFRYGLRLGQDQQGQEFIENRSQGSMISENLIIDIYSWLSPCDRVLVLLQLGQESNQQDLSELERNLSYSIIEWFILDDEHEVLSSDELRAVAWQILHACPVECSGLINIQAIQEKIDSITAGNKPLEKRNELWGVLSFSACQLLLKTSYLNRVKFTYDPPSIEYTIDQLHRFIELSCKRKNTILQRIALSLLCRLVRKQADNILKNSNLNKVSSSNINDYMILQEESTRIRQVLNKMEITVKREPEFKHLMQLMPLNLISAIQTVSDFIKNRIEHSDKSLSQQLNHQVRMGINAIIIHMYSGKKTCEDQTQAIFELVKLMTRALMDDDEQVNTYQASCIGKLFQPNEGIKIGEILSLRSLVGMCLKFRDQAFIKQSTKGAYAAAGWWHEETKDILLSMCRHSLDVKSSQMQIIFQSILLTMIASNDKFRFSSPETIEMGSVYNQMIFFNESVFIDHFVVLRHCGLLRAIIQKVIHNLLSSDVESALRHQSFIFLMSLIEQTRPYERDLILSDEIETIIQVLYQHAPVVVRANEKQQDTVVTSDEVFGAIMSRYTRSWTLDTSEFDQQHFLMRIGRILDMSLGTYYKSNGIITTPKEHKEMSYLQQCMFKWLASLDKKSEVSTVIKSSLDKWFQYKCDSSFTPEELASKKKTIMEKIRSMMPNEESMTKQQGDQSNELLEDLQSNTAHALDDWLTISDKNPLCLNQQISNHSVPSSFLKSSVAQRRRSNSMIPNERKVDISKRSNSISGDLRTENKNNDNEIIKNREAIEVEIDNAVGGKDNTVLRTLSRAMNRINQTQFGSNDDKDVFEHHDIYRA